MGRARDRGIVNLNEKLPRSPIERRCVKVGPSGSLIRLAFTSLASGPVASPVYGASGVRADGASTK